MIPHRVVVNVNTGVLCQRFCQEITLYYFTLFAKRLHYYWDHYSQALYKNIKPCEWCVKPNQHLTIYFL